MSGLTFPLVWFRYSESTWTDFELLAWQDKGTLEVRTGELEFRGEKYAFVIRDVTQISMGRQGRDFVNFWVRVDHMDGLNPLVGYFVDGSAAGWGGMLGGTGRIYTAVAQSMGLQQAGPTATVDESSAGVRTPATDLPGSFKGGNEKVAYCAGCGAPVLADHAYCATCGAKVIR
jgi:hypothetical protein